MNEVVQYLLDKKANNDNQIDLNAYALGLIDMCVYMQEFAEWTCKTKWAFLDSTWVNAKGEEKTSTELLSDWKDEQK
jgi:hypothetical protein